jgi:membrane-associated phospholipid phosphatase
MTFWQEQWGIAVIVWLQSFGDSITPLMRWITFLGNEEFYLLLMPAVLWCFHAGLGLRIGFILLTSSCLNSTLKLIFGLPRPFWVSSKVRALAEGSTYGMPSGHAQNAAAIWGRTAAWLEGNRARAALIFLIFLIGLSRVFLAVHFPSDVLVGWFLGGAILIVFLFLERSFLDRLRNASLGVQILTAALASLLLLGIGTLAYTGTAARGVPDLWFEGARQALPYAPAITPHELDGIVASSGTLFGVGLGGALLFAWGRFRADGPWGKRGLRYLLGAVGVAAIYYGLKLVLPGGDTLLPQALRYLRYALVGLWVSYLAPRLFVAMRLA